MAVDDEAFFAGQREAIAAPFRPKRSGTGRVLAALIDGKR
jgi:hypothetical protein